MANPFFSRSISAFHPSALDSTRMRSTIAAVGSFEVILRSLLRLLLISYKKIKKKVSGKRFRVIAPLLCL